MNWEVVAAISEAASALGVIATLVYLTIQVRQSKEATEANTRQMRGQAFFQLYEGVKAMTQNLMDNPELVDISAKANVRSWKELTSHEQRTAMLWFIQETGYYELAFMLWQEGALDEASYLSREEYFITLMLSPGRREWWDNHAILIDPRFRARIDQEVARARPDAPGLGERLPMFSAT
jgi:hypothetical protein